MLCCAANTEINGSNSHILCKMDGGLWLFQCVLQRTYFLVVMVTLGVSLDEM